jgi:hypothetical protein
MHSLYPTHNLYKALYFHQDSPPPPPSCRSNINLAYLWQIDIAPAESVLSVRKLTKKRGRGREINRTVMQFAGKVLPD